MAKELETIEIVPRDPTKVTKIGTKLQHDKKEGLVKFLKENQDIFAWSHEDMPRINIAIIQHRLNFDTTYKTVQKRKRIFAPNRNRAVIEQVEKLLVASFIRQVYYPEWLVNVVMAKKENAKWRMCVNFTNLNKACPKDIFPLPRIN